jgi:CRP/FNR family transcriptional regulator, cyclic AMP receptor protein
MLHKALDLIMAQKTETLAKIPLFRSLSADAIEKLDTRCSWRQVPGGQWLIDYQDASSNVFFVVSGAVRVVIQSAGREVLLRQINAGEFFGELAAIDNVPRSSGIVAVIDVTIACMSAAVFRNLLHAHPDICDQLLALLASQIRMLANRVNEFATLDVRHRIYAELLRLSRPEPGNTSCAIIASPGAHGNRCSRQHAA